MLKDCSPMDVTVFGAGGFVGTNVVNKLVDAGHDVRACDIKPMDLAPENITFFELDITDEERLDEVVEGADAIAHLAAHQLPDSLEQPKVNAEINVIGTLAILDAARKHDVKKVFFPSASSILGDVDVDAADEDTVPSPRSPYGVTKHAVEEYLQVYNRLYGLDYLVFRFFNVYGPHQYPESGAFVPVVMSRLARGEGVYVTGDGQQARDFVYVGDVAEFIVAGLESDVSNEVVNMGHGEGIALVDAIHTIAELVDVDPEIEHRPPREDEIGNFRADMEKCERLFGRSPSTDFVEGVQKTYRWLRNIVEKS